MKTNSRLDPKKNRPSCCGSGAACAHGSSHHAHGRTAAQETHRHPEGAREDDRAPSAAGCCGCGDGDGHGSLPGWPRLCAALALALVAELLHVLGGGAQVWEAGGMALAVAAIALAGTGIYMSGLRSLRRGRLGIDALMAVAVTGAFLIGQWPEAAMVMALYAIAERIEEAAGQRAHNAIRALMQLAPGQAEVRDESGQWTTVPVGEVALQEVVRVRPGGRVPLDGVIVQGQSAVDQSSVTGESIPVDRQAGDALFAGSINLSGEVWMQVSAAAGGTMLDRIIAAVERAQASRAPTQRWIERFAAIYTPGVFVLALALALLAPPLLGWTWLQAAYKALVLLVIACPCALVISVPVTVVSGLAAAARRNILIKGGFWLENARKLRVIALDKTGTVTEGKPALVHWQTYNGAGVDDTASQAASLAQRSDHPVSQAIARGLRAAVQEVQNFTVLPGRGAQASWAGGGTIALGNHRWLHEREQCSPALEAQFELHQSSGHSLSFLSHGQEVKAWFAVADTVRENARQAVRALHAMGIRTVMLSGDNQNSASAIAAQAGVEQARGELLPQDKQRAVQELQQQYGCVGMVGDGINDAAALLQADVGFAMGGAGTDVALEAADVVVMNDDLLRVVEMVELSRRTHRILMQNIGLALGIKAVFLVLAVAGLASMWMAVFADVGACLLVVANGLRLLKFRKTPTAGKLTRLFAAATNLFSR